MSEIEDLASQLESAEDKADEDAPPSSREADTMRYLWTKLPSDLKAERGVDLDAAAAAFSRTRRRRFTSVAAVAAILLVLAGWGLIHFSKDQDEDGGARIARVMGDVRLSLYDPLVERSRGVPDRTDEFHSGNTVFIHLSVIRDGVAFVAMLDSRNQFVPVSSRARSVRKETEFLGPFELDDNAGTESFVILASTKPLGSEDFHRIIRETAASVQVDRRGHDATLRRIIAELRSCEEVSVEAVTFRHLAR